ncbi:MAG: hypothetical protein RLZZ600_184 [Actinomycetota bacterium]|jgi:hypothetical protein
MKPYFIAALSFVGVLGSAAGAMAINNDTLTHGGSDLTESASRALISTSTVNPDGTLSIDGGGPGAVPGDPGAVDGQTPGTDASGAPLPPQALTNLPTLNYNGTTGGSSAGSGSQSGNSASGSSRSAARPIATPAAGSTSPVNGVTGGSASAAPAPGGGSTPPVGRPARDSHNEREHEGHRGAEDHDDNDDDSHESDDD